MQAYRSSQDWFWALPTRAYLVVGRPDVYPFAVRALAVTFEVVHAAVVNLVSCYLCVDDEVFQADAFPTAAVIDPYQI